MAYSYCPYCGYNYTSTTGAMYACAHCGRKVYLNSKPTAGVLIIDGDKVLLGKRAIDPARGKWDVIGGFLDYGEHPHEGAIREAKEETGLDVEIVEYLGTFMDAYGADQVATMNMCFTARVINGEPQANDDIAELNWFSKTDLPEDLAFENNRRMLEYWQRNYAD